MLQERPDVTRSLLQELRELRPSGDYSTQLES